MAFVEKEEEDKFKLGPDEGQEIGWFTIDEALTVKLTPGTRISLSEYRDLIEEMMKTKSVFHPTTTLVTKFFKLTRQI